MVTTVVDDTALTNGQIKTGAYTALLPSEAMHQRVLYCDISDIILILGYNYNLLPNSALILSYLCIWTMELLRQLLKQYTEVQESAQRHAAVTVRYSGYRDKVSDSIQVDTV